MVFSDDISYYGFPGVDFTNQKATQLIICLSIPAESKKLKRCLSPPMRVANKLTPEPKSKIAENMPEHTGREQKS